MDSQPLMLGSYPRAIVHIDGDAFFASCEQASNPKLKGRPVVTGRERGIAASMSYEAKARGVVFLRTHDFRDRGLEVRFSQHTNFPNEIIAAVRPLFDELCNPQLRYRSTGVVLTGLAEVQDAQLDLFGASFRIERMHRLFECVDAIKAKYGKHTLFLGSSFLAHKHAQHEGTRGTVPERRRTLFKGETKRKRLAIPMFLGKIE